MKHRNVALIAALFFICLIFTCCNQEEYPHEKGFEFYMEQKFDISISKAIDDIYYILPLSDCNSCLGTKLNLEYLSSIDKTNDKLNVIIVGQTNNASYKKMIQHVSSVNSVLTDTNNSIFDYQTGLSKPMLLHVKKGAIPYYLQISDFKIENARNYIETNS